MYKQRKSHPTLVPCFFHTCFKSQMFQDLAETMCSSVDSWQTWSPTAKRSSGAEEAIIFMSPQGAHTWSSRQSALSKLRQLKFKGGRKHSLPPKTSLLASQPCDTKSFSYIVFTNCTVWTAMSRNILSLLNYSFGHRHQGGTTETASNASNLLLGEAIR